MSTAKPNFDHLMQLLNVNLQNDLIINGYFVYHPVSGKTGEIS